MSAILVLQLFLVLLAPVMRETRPINNVLHAPAAVSQRGCSNPYTVRAGDTLAAIAQRCGVSVANLMQWNGLKFIRVFVGQRLVTRSWQTPLATPPASPVPRSAPQPTPTPRIEPRIKP